MKINLRKCANEIVKKHNLNGLRSIIEKEIIHYEILQSLSKHGLLDKISFQGGTCLRLCYGSERYSEDLDFAAGDNYDVLDLDAFGKALQKDLLKTYDVDVRVRQPKVDQGRAGVGVQRWTVVVDTAKERPDMPAQRIKLEVASVPPRTSEIHQVRINYSELSETYGQTLIKCQSPEEIMADKLVSFSATEGYIRHRDLWDIPWLSMRPLFRFDEVPDMVRMKHKDYGCDKDLPEMIALGCERASAQIDSAEFQKQMRRFLSPEVYTRTVASKDFRSVMVRELTEAYGLVAHALGMSDGVERARRNLAVKSAERRLVDTPIRGKTI